MPWKENPHDVIWIANRYFRSRQWFDARAEYELAARLCWRRNYELESACLQCVWECLEREAGRISVLVQVDVIDASADAD